MWYVFLSSNTKNKVDDYFLQSTLYLPYWSILEIHSQLTQPLPNSYSDKAIRDPSSIANSKYTLNYMQIHIYARTHVRIVIDGLCCSWSVLGMHESLIDHAHAETQWKKISRAASVRAHPRQRGVPHFSRTHADREICMCVDGDSYSFHD